jgi:hypothetical protein
MLAIQVDCEVPSCSPGKKSLWSAWIGQLGEHLPLIHDALWAGASSNIRRISRLFATTAMTTTRPATPLSTRIKNNQNVEEC